MRFTNFYKCFIKNFSHIAKPLNKLKGKKDWEWKEHQKTFEELKEKITSQLVLALSRKKRKIQSRDKYIRIYYWRSSISETKKRIETNCVFIKDNASNWKELWQRTTDNSKGSDKMKTIFIRYYYKFWSLDRLQKSQVF